MDEWTVVGGLVDRLLEEEGNQVILTGPNPEFFGPSHIVDVVGEFTQWNIRRFAGESRREALEKALRAMRGVKK